MNTTNGQAEAEASGIFDTSPSPPPPSQASPAENAPASAVETISVAPLSDPVQEAVQTIAALHARAERRVDAHQRMIERVSAKIGRPGSLYLVLLVVGLWIGVNVGIQVSGKSAWDAPPFSWLQGVIGLAALLTAIVVVITQQRQDIADERRAQLDLQISLVIEQKTTKLIALVEELRRDLPNVQNRSDPEAERMTESADPQVMLIALEHMLSEAVEEIGEMQDDADEKNALRNREQEENEPLGKPMV